MKHNRPHWIPVVTALIRNHGRVLLGKRPKGNSLADQWEFPGGKIELGESPEEALQRELREELSIEAEIGQLVLANTHSYGDRGVLLLFYDVHFWKGEPRNEHHQSLMWADPAQLKELDIPEANRRILPILMQILSQTK